MFYIFIQYDIRPKIAKLQSMPVAQEPSIVLFHIISLIARYDFLEDDDSADVSQQVCPLFLPPFI